MHAVLGLPFQTLEHVEQTIIKTKALLPDRLAFYSYAHVPWIKGIGQRGYKDSDLPSPELKREQYELGKKLLSQAGYYDIGMDHFALATDTLYKSMKAHKLHKCFRPYPVMGTWWTCKCVHHHEGLFLLIPVVRLIPIPVYQYLETVQPYYREKFQDQFYR